MEAVATPTTTSASATPAPVSTPAPSGATTSTPSAAPTPAERPKTMAEAFARDAAQHPTEATTPLDGATTPPVDGSDPQSATHPSTDSKAGPIPFEAHKTALENARTKATTEAQAAFDRDYGWAKQVPRESLEHFGQIASQMTSDPIGFLNQFVAELQANPVHAAQLRSNAGRMLAAKQANTEPPPDVEIVDANGQVTGTTYSADRLAKRDAWNRAQLMADVQKEYGPLKTERDRQVAQRQADETTQQINVKADEVLSEVTDILDGNKALMGEVSKLMDANPRWTAHKAALEVRKMRIAPALAGKAQTDVLESLKTKAAAQAVNPASAVVAATSRPKSFMDKSLKW